MLTHFKSFNVFCHISLFIHIATYFVLFNVGNVFQSFHDSSCMHEFQSFSKYFSFFDVCFVFHHFHHFDIFWRMSCLSMYFKTFHQCKWIKLLMYFNIFQVSKYYFDVFWFFFNVFQRFCNDIFPVFQHRIFCVEIRQNTWNAYFNGTLFQRISTYFTPQFRWWRFNNSPHWLLLCTTIFLPCRIQPCHMPQVSQSICLCWWTQARGVWTQL